MSGFKADTQPSEPATRSRAFRIIENLELLKELLAGKAIASEVVDLLFEPTHGAQLLRVSGALHALDDLRKAIEAPARRGWFLDNRRAQAKARRPGHRQAEHGGMPG